MNSFALVIIDQNPCFIYNLIPNHVIIDIYWLLYFDKSLDQYQIILSTTD